MQDLALWNKSDQEKPQTTQQELVHVMDWDLKVFARPGKTSVQEFLMFASKYLPDSKKAWEKVLWSDETIWKLKKFLSKTQRTSTSQSTAEGKTSCFGPVFFLHIVKGDFPALRGYWIRAMCYKCWMKISFSSARKHYRWFVDGPSNMVMTQHLLEWRRRRERLGEG